MANKLELTANNKRNKAQILRVIVTHLVENSELGEEFLEEVKEETSEQIALRRLELEVQVAYAKLEAREKECEFERQQKILEAEAQQREIEAQNQQKILEAEAQQRELDARRLEIEAKASQLQLEIEAQNHSLVAQLQLEATKKQQLEIQKQMAEANNRLESQRLASGHGNTSNIHNSNDSNPIRINKYTELPKFNEEDPEVFFSHFSKIAVSMNWPMDQWVAIMQSQLKGRSQEVFASLPDENSFDYELVKKSILNAYQLNPEVHRQKFRNLKKASEQTIAEFNRLKTNYCNRWLKSLYITDYDALKNLLITEEVLSCLPDKLSTSMAEQKNSTDIYELSKLADEHEF
ncbi:calponin homology domain-containing protein DDB_G0272472-like [Procambarus clarkii]|uniref:calponin homology domain-containing protein DDB_G0272472-like n=1 Tax=Procambarus clarkii TaxID=6728 RepID=UPI003743A59F